jgi:hypothetical protein
VLKHGKKDKKHLAPCHVYELAHTGMPPKAGSCKSKRKYVARFDDELLATLL